MNRSYPAKLLLFGEYAILAGGEALAIPYPQYQLAWKKHKPAGTETKQHLKDYLAWLKENNFAGTLNLERFENDLKEGLDVESNIPFGFGLGSSGAVVAAVYNRYCGNMIDEKDLVALRSYLASMENYFHKQSSGLDPLVSFLQKPIHVTPSGMKIIPQSKINESRWKVDLINTGIHRETSAMVERFNEMMQLQHYKERIEKEYLPLVHECIEGYLGNKQKGMHDILFKLSMFQMTAFEFAIPSSMHLQWSLGLTSRNYMKLCGAGGGGFMITITEK